MQYFQHGRYETLDLAKQADDGIKRLLSDNNIKFVEFDFDHIDDIFAYIWTKIVEKSASADIITA